MIHIIELAGLKPMAYFDAKLVDLHQLSKRHLAMFQLNVETHGEALYSPDYKKDRPHIMCRIPGVIEKNPYSTETWPNT